MNFDTSWDVEKYRNKFESDEQWELRKTFMLTHKHKFAEDKLVCLAQTFLNIEFLGCTYPKETMTQVEELAREIAADHRKGKKEKLQRTFIKASDAAEAKIKASHRRPDTQSGTSGFHESLKKDNAQLTDYVTPSSRSSSFYNSQEYQTMRHENIATITASDAAGAKIKASHRRPDTQSGTSGYHESLLKKNNAQLTDYFTPSSSSSSFYNSQEHQTMRHENISIFKRNKNAKLLERLQHGKSDLGLPLDFIIMTDSKDFLPMNILDQSVRLANINLDFVFSSEDDQIKCEVYLNDLLMGQAVECTNKTSKNKAVIMTIELLRKNHFVLEKKCKFVPGTLLNTKSIDKAEDMPLAEDNVGLKMMLKMGWTGSGLGHSQQGIVAPVKATSQIVNRAGLGTDGGVPNSNSMRNKFQNIFREFSASDTKTDLVFSSDLSSLERKLLHELAHKFKLKSQSFGKGQERQLVISKPLCPKQIVNDLLVCGQMENEKYRLIKPENL